MSKPSAGLARRRFPRRLFRRTISVLHRGSYQVGEARELGEGGMLVELGDKIKVGGLVLVNFLLPSTGLCIVQAEVKSERLGECHNAYGLLFINLDYDGKKGIRDYIATSKEEYQPPSD